ncbi:MAG: hypothetical protein ABJC89_15165 [Acidobacteriota bacterium]
MKRFVSALLCAALLCSGCASTSGGRMAAAPVVPARVDPALFAAYVTHLPIGARVRVALAGGDTISGTLMKADAGGIVVQPRTRIPEPPMALAADRIARVELDTAGPNLAKTVGIGIASGAGGVFAAFLIIAAIFAGD